MVNIDLFLKVLSILLIHCFLGLIAKISFLGIYGSTEGLGHVSSILYLFIIFM